MTVDYFLAIFGLLIWWSAFLTEWFMENFVLSRTIKRCLASTIKWPIGYAKWLPATVCGFEPGGVTVGYFHAVLGLLIWWSAFLTEWFMKNFVLSIIIKLCLTSSTKWPIGYGKWFPCESVQVRTWWDDCRLLPCNIWTFNMVERLFNRVVHGKLCIKYNYETLPCVKF